MTNDNVPTPRRVIIAGVGGNGSWVAPAIGRILNFNAPDSQLLLVDGDTFEPKNAERQNFRSMGNKAKSVAGDLIDILDNVNVVAIAKWIVPEDDEGASDDGMGTIKASDLLQEDDIVFICVDNHAARKLLYDAAQNLNNITIMNGGNEDDGFGSTYLYIRRDGVDVTDHPGVHHPEFINPPDRNPGTMSCAERAELPGGTQVIATNMAVAASMVFDIRNLIWGDETSEDKPDNYYWAAGILTSEKMFHLNYGQAHTWARCSKDLFDEMCLVNEDVAEICYDKVVDLVVNDDVTV